MKNIKSVILLFVLFTVSNAVFAQTTPKVIAVVSKAKWCPICVKNEGRIVQEVLSALDVNQFNLVVNDLSDKETKTASSGKLKVLGLKVSDFKATGNISFVDSKSKKVISTISVAESSDKIKEAFAVSLNKK